jgi:hypothetical protein
MSEKMFRIVCARIMDITCVQVLTRLTVDAAKRERNPKRLREPSSSSLSARQKTKHRTPARFGERKRWYRRERKKVFL